MLWIKFMGTPREIILNWMPHIRWLVNIGSGNGLVSQLFVSMLT